MRRLFLIQLAIESLYDSLRERLRQRDYCQNSKGSDIGASWFVVNYRVSITNNNYLVRSVILIKHICDRTTRTVKM
jgi:hypothetical protein